MTPDEARERFAAERVARLATVGEGGRPHLVPIVFAVAGDTVYHAVDHKPKRTTALQRLANAAAEPRVALLADAYDDADWSQLWWVRADGRARVLMPDGDDEARRAVALLVERYAQYRETPPAGPVLAVDVERWSGWQSS
jgi:PPOX class probable F420-dependent enzyme